MTIYTKKGDKGRTATIESNKQNGKLDKDSLRVEAIGAVDEINTFLGIARSQCVYKEIDAVLFDIQNDLFVLNSKLAGAKISFTKAKTTKLEKLIDEKMSVLPKISNFVINAGSPLATNLQYARTLARRAERQTVSLSKEERLPGALLAYLNRLSDALWVVSRWVNFEAGIEETIWAIKKK